jgi:hypothetical protein
MPILRTEIVNFVRLWNAHRIRKQRNRPNGVFGKPWMLYYHPEPPIEDYGLEIDPEALQSWKWML